MRVEVPIHAFVLAVLTGVASGASAQIAYMPGSAVQASPTQTSGNWQDCVVVSGPDQYQSYRLRCDAGGEQSVPAKWIRPGGGPKGLPRRAGGGGTLAPAPPIARERVPQPSSSATPSPAPSPKGATLAPAAPAPSAPAPRAPTPQPQPQPQQGASGSVALGSYECWAWGRARMLLNFTVTGPSRYTASDGTAGTFTFDPASKAIRFTGFLANSMPEGFTTIYYEPHGTPTVSFRGPGGSEASFCERTR